MKVFLRMLWLLLVCKTPWYRALVTSAWNKYKESELFRLRWIEFSQKTAAELYTLHEHRHFVSKVKEDKELMKQIWLHPYSILNEGTEWDYELRKCIKF